MKATIELSPAQAGELLAQWASEHEGYYGTPCGYRSVEDAGRNFRPASPLPEGVVHLGYTPLPGGGVWLRSSGTWARVAGHTLTVAGPRHSVRELIPDWIRQQPWRILDSREPGLAPWLTTTP